MNKQVDIIAVEDLSEPLTFSVEAFTSIEYARAEEDKLWAKIWQHAGRIEEIPNVGDFITYDILNRSVLIVRTASNDIKAYYNVCSHRGRQLVDVPQGVLSVRGRRSHFVCGYHGWQYDLDGHNTKILNKSDWKGALTAACTQLDEVKVDTWGGWIFINFDPDCESLREYLEPAASMLDPFEFERMRYRWRQWVVFDCNWKTALEAFMEPYHVEGTHPQLSKYGDFYAWSKAHGLHGNDGFDDRNESGDSAAATTVHRTGKGADARAMIAEMQKEFYETVNGGSTQMMVDAAARLVDELPEGTPADDVHHHWLHAVKSDYAAIGVKWPNITGEQMAQAGLAWHIFPNMSILQGPVFALCYRTRPYGSDPNKCIYESYAIERFEKDKEPKTEWVYADIDSDKWPLVLKQDFSNMAAVQKGMRNPGFRGTLPNPYQERKVTNFHRNLAEYIGAGSPRLLKK